MLFLVLIVCGLQEQCIFKHSDALGGTKQICQCDGIKKKWGGFWKGEFSGCNSEWWADSEYKPTSNSQFHTFSTMLCCLTRTSSYVHQDPSNYFQRKLWSLIRALSWDRYSLEELILQISSKKAESKCEGDWKQSKATNLPTVWDK